jgi:hypothetical protein
MQPNRTTLKLLAAICFEWNDFLAAKKILHHLLDSAKDADLEMYSI